MELLDLTLPTPEENLALDEALLDEADAGGTPRETLRLWEPRQSFVVVGRSSPVEQEVQLDRCRERGIPVFRRVSGGAAIVAGPGCLLYAVILSYELHPELRMLDQAHRYVLRRVQAAVERLRPGVELQGTSDLAWEGRKFSGNSLRCKRDHLLYHGTLLVDYPLELVEDLLGLAPRQPAYRAGRSHRDFIANLHVSPQELRQSLAAAWQATSLRSDWPRQATAELAAGRYRDPQWNLHA